MLGHNNPPNEFARVDDLVKNADRWKSERATIESAEIADKAAAFLTQLRAEAKSVEDARKAEKQPHLDAGKAIDARFKTQVDRLTAAANAIKALLTPYLERKEAERVEAERKARAEAEAAEANAREQAEKASGIDDQIAAQQAAEDAAQRARDAELLAKSRASVSSSMGGRAVSLRTTRVGVIIDQGKVYRKFKDDPRVVEVLQKIVNAEVRAKRNVPGVEVRDEKQAA